MNLNPNAVAFWLFCTGIGFLCTQTLFGAIAGFVVGLGVSLFASIFS
jgi:hypothetical protein